MGDLDQVEILERADDLFSRAPPNQASEAYF